LRATAVASARVICVALLVIHREFEKHSTGSQDMI
jgi:hypothetical protein